MKQRYKLMLGDNMELLKKIPDNSIDSVVTDAPYGLGKERDMNIILKDWIEKGYSEIEGTGFMGKEWDAYVPQPQFWKEIFRVLKPGGHILAFFGTRTYDIGTMAIRMAGFEIRDQIMWLYGSGFPKSLNIGKAVDKSQGKEIPKNKMRIVNSVGIDNYDGTGLGRRYDSVEYNVQNEYEGWGTALKPANEPICLARKPLSEKSVAENVLKWKTGGINVDGCRIGSDTITTNGYGDKGFVAQEGYEPTSHEGRFPANIILECICDEVIKGEKGEPFLYKGKEYNNKDTSMFNGDKPEAPSNYNDKGDIHTNPDCPCRLLDEQSGVSKSQSGTSKTKINNKEANWFRNSGGETEDRWGFGDSGGASRFFYQAKVSKAERNMGLDHFEDKETKGSIGLHSVGGSPTKDNNRIQKNTHPTVKPINLMTYLCRLITPEGGIVLDPFMGSGSTGIAAQLEGFRFVGMEMDEEYMKIATARMENYEKYKKFIK